jgi:hypothetical protein
VVCRLVDGIPLAIELAVAWVDTLALADMAGEIERGLDFLQAPMRDVPERHHSIQAVFDSSWRRLTDIERDALAQLSVFRGGITRAAAEEVIALQNGAPPTLRALAEREYARARREFQERVAALTSTGEKEHLARSLAGLADEDDPKLQQRAAELYALAESHPLVANSQLFEDITGRHVKAAAATLSPDIVEAAQTRERALDWWATAEELVEELNNLKETTHG